jgi:hypothetical protein
LPPHQVTGVGPVVPLYGRVEGGHDGLGGAPADAWHLGDLLQARRGQPLHRAEPAQQRLAPDLAQSGHAVEGGRGHPLRPPLPVERDGEPVRLVPYPLQQIEPFGRTGKDDRERLLRRHTSSSRLARPHTATSVMPSSRSTAPAAFTWGAPPSTTTRFGA